MEDIEFEESSGEADTRLESRPELPSLDLQRLAHRVDDLPLHQQQTSNRLDMSARQQMYRGPTNALHNMVPNKGIRKAQKLRLAKLSQLDGGTKAKVSRSVQTAHVKSWLHRHGYVVKADKLHPAVTRVIAEWFELVDDDNSKTLEHHELLAALKAAHVPCDDATIKEMIELMDMNKDGVIDWDEFEVFMTEEFAAGKQLLQGEYILPSGLSINFGVMIGKLKRNKLMKDAMDTKRRHKWAAIASNPEAMVRELATMQEAAEATSLTLDHLKRSEGNGLGIPTPRTQLTAALLRAATDPQRLAVKTEDPGRSIREKLRATAMGLEVSRAAQSSELLSPVGSPLRAAPDSAAQPHSSSCYGDIGFYMTGVPDTLMPPPLPTYTGDIDPAYPSYGPTGPYIPSPSGCSAQRPNRSDMPSAGTSALASSAATSSAVPTTRLSSHGDSLPLPCFPARLPERRAGPSSAPVNRLGGRADMAIDAGASDSILSSALYSPTLVNDMVSAWPAAPSATSAYRPWRATDQPHSAVPYSGAHHLKPTADSAVPMSLLDDEVAGSTGAAGGDEGGGLEAGGRRLCGEVASSVGAAVSEPGAAPMAPQQMQAQLHTHLTSRGGVVQSLRPLSRSGSPAALDPVTQETLVRSVVGRHLAAPTQRGVSVTKLEVGPSKQGPVHAGAGAPMHSDKPSLSQSPPLDATELSSPPGGKLAFGRYGSRAVPMLPTSGQMAGFSESALAPVDTQPQLHAPMPLQQQQQQQQLPTAAAATRLMAGDIPLSSWSPTAPPQSRCGSGPATADANGAGEAVSNSTLAGPALRGQSPGSQRVASAAHHQPQGQVYSRSRTSGILPAAGLAGNAVAQAAPADGLGLATREWSQHSRTAPISAGSTKCVARSGSFPAAAPHPQQPQLVAQATGIPGAAPLTYVSGGGEKALRPSPAGDTLGHAARGAGSQEAAVGDRRRPGSFSTGSPLPELSAARAAGPATALELGLQAAAAGQLIRASLRCPPGSGRRSGSESGPRSGSGMGSAASSALGSAVASALGSILTDGSARSSAAGDRVVYTGAGVGVAPRERTGRGWTSGGSTGDSSGGGAGSRPGRGLSGTTRGASGAGGASSDVRHPPRPRAQHALGSDREELATSAWSAAAASILQLRLSQQLIDQEP